MKFFVKEVLTSDTLWLATERFIQERIAFSKGYKESIVGRKCLLMRYR